MSLIPELFGSRAILDSNPVFLTVKHTEVVNANILTLELKESEPLSDYQILLKIINFLHNEVHHSMNPQLTIFTVHNHNLDEAAESEDCEWQ